MSPCAWRQCVFDSVSAEHTGFPAASPLSAAIPLRGRLAVNRYLPPWEVPGGSVMPKTLPHTPALGF